MLEVVTQVSRRTWFVGSGWRSAKGLIRGMSVAIGNLPEAVTRLCPFAAMEVARSRPPAVSGACIDEGCAPFRGALTRRRVCHVSVPGADACSVSLATVALRRKPLNHAGFMSATGTDGTASCRRRRAGETQRRRGLCAAIEAHRGLPLAGSPEPRQSRHSQARKLVVDVAAAGQFLLAANRGMRRGLLACRRSAGGCCSTSVAV